ncbi:hypothetical protein DLAC_05836 [Tieghemostelium lacteum]|uniref:Uncharacterized protein n=1 Tax=Tieghemostelium lacteum TaxID=361077 RepID=A0A151ZGT6_TIELA|nr:hypothetical protein DLAC_05836 [Tieghemostelium lacteum]|eukprot:KYQ93198.1 hypothetical protein DLAC_05836 [Tieghemostelium lacteum]
MILKLIVVSVFVLVVVESFGEKEIPELLAYYQVWASYVDKNGKVDEKGIACSFQYSPELFNSADDKGRFIAYMYGDKVARIANSSLKYRGLLNQPTDRSLSEYLSKTGQLQALYPRIREGAIVYDRIKRISSDTTKSMTSSRLLYAGAKMREYYQSGHKEAFQKSFNENIQYLSVLRIDYTISLQLQSMYGSNIPNLKKFDGLYTGDSLRDALANNLVPTVDITKIKEEVSANYNSVIIEASRQLYDICMGH